MRRYHLTCALLSFFCLTHLACAQSKKGAARGTTPVVLDAWKQRVLPGRQEGSIQTTYTIALKLMSQPGTPIYFHSPNGWLHCTLSPATFNSTARQYIPQPRPTNMSRKGDTVLVTATQAATVSSLPKNTKPNTLILKQKSGWLHVPVTEFRKIDDMDMP